MADDFHSPKQDSELVSIHLAVDLRSFSFQQGYHHERHIFTFLR